jgi:nucleoside-diphosphate-sugar epimerase
MKILLIGGTAFTGPYVARLLVQKGHEVTLFTRGNKEVNLPPEVKRLTGDRQKLVSFLSDFNKFSPDIVLDMIPMRQEDARNFMLAFKEICERVVGLSSIDVYLALVALSTLS